MKIQIDSFMMKGSTHRICEDYIIHGTDPFPYVILSDGCSTAPNTDVGARLLVHAAKGCLEAIKKGENISTIEMVIANTAFASAKLIGLPIESLFGTLIILWYDEEKNEVRLLQWGDGVGFANEDKTITDVRYSNNAPYYLAYNLLPNVKQHFLEVSKKNLKYYWQVEDKSYKNTFEAAQPTQPLDYQDIVQPENTLFLIMSDGISSVVKPNSGILPLTDVIHEISDFKRLKGEFITRQVTGLLRTKFSECYPLDDFSIGGFAFTE